MYFIEKLEQEKQKDYETHQRLVEKKLSSAKEKAEKNDEEAMFFLAIHYSNDRNSDYDPVEGYHYFQRLYAKGNNDVLYMLARRNLLGIGVEKNIYRAMEYFQACVDDHDNAFSVAARLHLADIYFFADGQKDIDRGIDQVKKFITSTIDSMLSENADFPLDDMNVQDENQFRFLYDQEQEAHDYAKYLKDALSKMEYHLPVDFTLLESKDHYIKDISKFFLSYCYLTGQGKEKDTTRGLEIFKEGLNHFIKTQKFELIKADVPAYLPNYPAGEMDQPLNPYGYVLDEDDVLEFKENQEYNAKHHVPSAILFLAFGYYGKFKYFPKDIVKAIEYFKEAYSLNLPEAAYHLAKIYHDGLDDGIIDYQRSKDYLNKAVSLGFNQANLLLAKYALLDDKDILACTTHLLNYAKKEQESDKIMFEATTQNNFQNAENQDPELDEYFASLKSGYEHSTMGIDAYEEKDYDKAVSYLEKGAKEYGMTQAAIMMAICYLNGHGITKDEKIALEIIDELIYTEIF